MASVLCLELGHRGIYTVEVVSYIALFEFTISKTDDYDR